MTQLFPENLGPNDQGNAVVILQSILKARGLDPDDRIVVNGYYGDTTAQAVKRLQEELDVTVDGNFGPVTRAAFHRQTGFNVTIILADVFKGEARAVAPS